MTVVTMVMLGYRYAPEHLMAAGPVERTIALALYIWERLQDDSDA
jgi:hypothetical protein